MVSPRHFQKLQRLHSEAPSSLYDPADLHITAGRGRITFHVVPEDHSVGGLVDPSIYFKLLSDASTLAAGSLVEDHFVFIDSFDVQVHRPVAEGVLSAIAHVVSARGTVFMVEAILVDTEGRRVAGGRGVLSRSAVALPEDEAILDEAANVPDEPQGTLVQAVAWESPYGLVFLN